MNGSSISGRLESLDILRGFDLFCLVGLEHVVHAMSRAVEGTWFQQVVKVFSHVGWEGFSPWDLVMPLFMFMAGVTIPFSRSRTVGQRGKMWVRIIKRVVILWLFGMMSQGNLLSLDPDHFYLYSNTLQAIATGYLVAVLLYMVSSLRIQIGVAVLLLLVYWAGMEFITVDGFGGGNYTPDANFAEWVDRVCLGRFRDGATVAADGSPVFASWYHYTWIWSSLTFAVTVMLGMFAGTILKSGSIGNLKKALWLLGGGALMVIAGLFLGNWHPIIKKIWTVSMTLFSGGICWMLMAVFYYVIDYLGFRKGLGWLKVYGMNSIVAYMLMSCVNFRCVAASFLYGLEQYIGPWYDVALTAFSAVIIYVVLLVLYRNRVFLKV